MEALLTFVIAAAVTLFFVRRYLKAAASSAGSPARTPPPQNEIDCPRCSKPVPSGSAFCPACGVPMALWTVRRAPEQTTSPGEAGARPRPLINASLCIGCGSCVNACPETGTLAVLTGKAILSEPDRCVGHAKCVDACPTSAITLAFGSAVQTLRAPLVKSDFETNIAGVFIAGELSGMGLIKTAINEGRLAIDAIRKRLNESDVWYPLPQSASGGSVVPEQPSDIYDVVIAGAGPAGLSASLTALQHGLRYLTIEQGEVAATIRNYPRHKFLMAEPVEMPLYGSLYVGDSTKESLLNIWETIIANTGVRIRTGERLHSITRRNGELFVETSKDSYRTRYVLLALGKRGTPRRIGVPGEDLDKVSYRLIEAASYRNCDLLVVGGGDSALEAALALSAAGANRVTLSYRGSEFRKARERNRTSLSEAEASGRLTVLRNSQVTTIMPRCVVLDTGCGVVTLANDFVFILAGGEPPETLLRKIGIEMVEKVISL